jgi:hypothetical protein
VEERQAKDIETGSISSITSFGATTESTITRRNDDETRDLIREFKAIENKLLVEREVDRAAQNEIIAKEREKTNEGMDRFRRDVVEVMKAGREEMREEESKRRAQEDEKWEKRMSEMMGIISKMEFKSNL